MDISYVVLGLATGAVTGTFLADFNSAGSHFKV